MTCDHNRSPEVDEGRLAQVLVAPVVSEKATMVAEKHNQVLFKVLRDATKPEIKAAVELIFKVDVESVQTVTQKGKVKRFGRSIGRRDHVKKAYVSLKAGQEINFSGRARNGRRQSETDLARPPREWSRWCTRTCTRASRGVAARAADAERRPQQHRPHHDAPPGRRPQAPLPRCRLRAQQGRHPGEGRAHRVRPEPHRAHRAGLLRRRRAPLHHRPARPRGRRDHR